MRKNKINAWDEAMSAILHERGMKRLEAILKEYTDSFEKIKEKK